jgi:ribonuclease D
MAREDEHSYRWIDRREDLEGFLADLRGLPQVAMDLEADSMYRYRERICLIQFSSLAGDAIVDPLALPDLEPLRALLENDRVEKVLHGADYDIRLLKQFASMRPSGLFDTMIAAQLLGLPRVGLSDLLEERFGVRLEKRFQRADWGCRPISPAMILYALQDTHHLLSLREELGEELRAKGRLGWAEEEFQALSQVEPNPKTSPDTFRIHGARGLDDQGRAVLQALLDWREELAQKRDVPTFRVMGTAMLVELAARTPTSIPDMREISGITSKVLRIWGEDILRAVKRGLTASPIAWRHHRSVPRRRPRPGGYQRFPKLKAVRDGVAHRLALNPGVLCPNASLKSLAEAWPEELEARMADTLNAWQREVLAEVFKRVLG